MNRQVRAAYVGALSANVFHVRDQDSKTCYKAILRKKLMRGRRSQTTLKYGQVLVLEKIQGSKIWKIMEKLNTYAVVTDDHECNYDEED